MDTVTTRAQLIAALKMQRIEGKTIGFVPTMGNLHDGHISLIRQAKTQSDFVVCSIFVNPLQFGKNEDLDAYPRTLAEDRAKLTEADCDLLFTPEVSEIYGNDAEFETIVRVPRISEQFCGKSRPGHFDGVATVVSKLFNMVMPHHAYFGLKDYQQFLVINKMVKDLAVPIEIIGVETIRERNGLAMSSRNNYLSHTQRDIAASLNRVLLTSKEAILAGNRDFSAIIAQGAKLLNESGMVCDYLAICNADDLSPAIDSSRRLVILAAAYLGTTRLIDNIRFALNGASGD